jgi:cell pole-organizing protein PopZ
MSDNNAQEPTMEEILASIRRIISEDDAPAAAAPEAAAEEPEAEAAAPEPPPPPEAEPEPAPPAEPFALDEGDDDDVLELTNPEPPPPAFEPEPEPAFEPEPVQTLGDIDIAPRAAPRAEPEPAPAASYTPISVHDEDGLTAPPTADAAASIFGHLSRTLAMPAEHRTLEDVVRELLRPMLKQWLDDNLPAIVETAVQAEVERIARRRL